MKINFFAFKNFATKMTGFITSPKAPKGIISSVRDIAQYANVQKGGECDTFVKTIEDTISKYSGKEYEKTIGQYGQKIIKFKDGRIYEHLKTDGAISSSMHYPNGITKEAMTIIEKKYNGKTDTIRTLVQYNYGGDTLISADTKLHFPCKGGFIVRKKIATVSDPAQKEIYSKIQ